MSADAILGGTFDDYTLDTTINGTALEWAGQSIDRATAKAMVTAEAIDVSSLELHQGAGYLDGRVRYAWETGAYNANLKGDRLSWQGTRAVAERHAGDLRRCSSTARARPRSRRDSCKLDFALTGGKAGTFIGAGDATADLLGDQARIVARLPSIGALINADVATASPYDYRVTAQLDRFELARLSPFMGAIETEILGFANGTVTASGRLADRSRSRRLREHHRARRRHRRRAGVAAVAAQRDAARRRRDVEGFVRARRLGPLERVGRVEHAARRQLPRAVCRRLPGCDPARQGVRRAGDRSTAPAPMQFDLRSNGSRLGTVGTLAIKNGTFGWVGAPAAVQELNINAALNGEQLTIERITGNVATGGVVGSFSAKGAAKVPELTLAAIDGAIVARLGEVHVLGHSRRAAAAVAVRVLEGQPRDGRRVVAGRARTR